MVEPYCSSKLLIQELQNIFMQQNGPRGLLLDCLQNVSCRAGTGQSH